MFARVAPDPEDGPFVIEKWRQGPVAIVVLAYAFAQYRIQIWYYDHGIPDVLPPEC